MTSVPNKQGRFGAYGGRYVPETLMPALLELEQEYALVKKDRSFQAELAYYLKQYVGRPTSLYFAQRLTKRLGGARWVGRRSASNNRRVRTGSPGLFSHGYIPAPIQAEQA